MKLDSQYPFNLEDFERDNESELYKQYESSNEWHYLNDPDWFEKRKADRIEETISEMVEAYEEKLREMHGF